MKNVTKILTGIVILAILVYAGVSLVKIFGKIVDAQAEKAALERQVQQAEAENDRLLYAIEHSDEDQVIEDYARSKLGLEYGDAQVFYAE